MNIKSLLLGSAAALVAVSGARAADAVVVAEPEPMEYVRICDTYGVGFYYIPGTETCLRISGLLRFDVDYNDIDDTVVTTPATTTTTTAVINGVPSTIVTTTPATTTIVNNGLDDGFAASSYARVNLDARSETEFGTFRRFIRISGKATGGADAGAAVIEYAYIELGGLLVGLYDTLYDGDLAPEFDSAGGSSAEQIRYTFDAGNGITLQASVEDQDFNFDFKPNVVGRIGYAAGFGSLAGFVAYDATTEEVGVKAIASFTATDAITIQALGTYESGRGDFSVATGAHVGYEFSIAGAVGFKATDKLTFWGGGQYFNNSHANGSDEYKIGGQIDYLVVENLLARVQAGYNGGDDQDFVDAKFRLESSF